MNYSVQLSPHAAREYRKLDPSVREQIHAAINVLQQNPLTGPRIKRLKGRLRDCLRYRSGDYRIVYAVNQRARAVFVDYIQHRRDVYRLLE